MQILKRNAQVTAKRRHHYQEHTGSPLNSQQIVHQVLSVCLITKGVQKVILCEMAT